MSRSATPVAAGLRSPADVSAMVSDCPRGSGGEVNPRLARPSPGWRLRIQAQVSQDLLDHRPLQDGRDDLQLPGAAVRAVLHVDVEDRLSNRAQLIRCGRA